MTDSYTLSVLAKYLPIEVSESPPEPCNDWNDNGQSITLPFDVETFCREIDAKIAELEVEVKRLSECCTRRGARMQKMYHVLRCCMKRETISIPEWNELVGWFDADGVPK